MVSPVMPALTRPSETTGETWLGIRADFNDWAIHIKFQSTDDDLVLIDSLYGRDALPHNASSEEIKAEALAQALRDSTYEDGFKGA